MTINERFFSLLEEKGISQKHFSEKTGISTQTISAWKKRKTDPPSYLISTIADFFTVTIGYFLTGEEPKYLSEGKKNDLDDLELSEKQLLTYYKEMSTVERNILLGKAAEIYAKKMYIESDQK